MTPALFKEKGWAHLNNLLQLRQAIILHDSNTKQCLDYLIQACPATANCAKVEVPAGEKHKTLKTCEMVWYRLTELGADRNTIIINLGGGVLTDLGGFVASTFMRGIRFVHIPTSLLGMVDAAIGGKTGVDFGGLKNMIGVFSRAESIIVDSNFLKTLPSQHYRNGLAEVLKHAFISDPELLVMMEENEDELIARSIQVKLDVVQRDELESGERKKLNFGHTIGHALESFLLDSDREVLHGEAVAAGMVMESYLSTVRAGLQQDELKSICDVLDSVFTRVNLDASDWESIKKLMLFDKKNTNGSVRFVLLKSLGSATFDRAVSEQELDEAFHFYSK